MKKTALYAVMALVGLLGWVALTWWLKQAPMQFGADADPTSKGAHPGALPLVLGYVMTLLGAVLGAMFRELQAIKQRGRNTINPRTFFRGVFRSTDLWLSVMASPIAYAVIWKTLDASNIASLITVAVQNGLCCTVVASSLVAQPSEEGESPAGDEEQGAEAPHGAPAAPG